jgi:uncharacterized protein (DUF1501 family)
MRWSFGAGAMLALSAAGAPAPALAHGLHALERRAHGGNLTAARTGHAAALRECLSRVVFETPTARSRGWNAGLARAAQTVYAFQRDLEAQGLADRVFTLVWLEFGRRPRENASVGTAHGTAGCGFVVARRRQAR